MICLLAVAIRMGSYLDGKCGGSDAFSLSVSFDDDTAEGAPHERQHGSCQRGRSDDKEADASAHALLDFTQHQLVPDGIVADDASP